MAEDYEVEKKRLGGSAVKSAWARGGQASQVTYGKFLCEEGTSAIHLLSSTILRKSMPLLDVTAYGNNMLPGYESRSVPDTMTIGSERFQYAFDYY